MTPCLHVCQLRSFHVCSFFHDERTLLCMSMLERYSIFKLLLSLLDLAPSWSLYRDTEVLSIFFCSRLPCWNHGIELEVEFTQITHLVFLSTWVHLGNTDILSFPCGRISICLLRSYIKSYLYRCFRLHGVCKENPLAHVIGRLGLPLYRTSGDNSVLYDHDLER